MNSYINDNFGSRRGFYRYCEARVLGWFGYWNKHTDFQLNSVQRLIFVCNGNICRSPLAEAVARHSGCNSESFGMRCTRGASADPRAIAFAAERNIDLESHRARPIDDYKPVSGDLVIGMETRHIDISQLAGTENIYSTLLGLWAKDSCAYIHDPYVSTPEYFRNCLERVINATETLARGCITGK